MASRKEFLKTSAVLMAGGMAFSNKSFASLLRPANYPPAGLQLFTFFNEIDEDVPGTLKKIAAAGYKEIESAFSKKGGYYGMKPKEFAAMVKDLGMSWKSHHVFGAPYIPAPGSKPPQGPDGKPITIPPMKNLRENMKQVVDDAVEGGVEYLVCANTPIATLAEVHRSIEVLNKADDACKDAGIGFAYHNHDAEFRTVEGKIPYDLFLSQTHVNMELDLAWAIKGGRDPIQLFKQYPERFPLWHVKDLDDSKEFVMPVGQGIINFRDIFGAASAAGMKHFFVEHDMPKDPLTSVTSSIVYLNKLLK